MKEYITLDSAPVCESCVQVNSEMNYIADMVKECYRYKKLLEKKFPCIGKTYFDVKQFEHDFGPYFEVVLHYDDEIEIEENFAFNVEANLPEYWEK
jgi:hypothetical protein